MKKAFKILTHPIFILSVVIGILWFFFNLWLSAGFALGFAAGLVFGIKGTWIQIKLRYALYPLDQVPAVQQEEKKEDSK